jgi:hypothetical protein
MAARRWPAIALAAGLAACDRSGSTPAASAAAPAATTPATDAPATASSESIRIVLAYDAQTGKTSYQVDGSPPGEAAMLVLALYDAQQEWARTHGGLPPVKLELSRSVPWKDVVMAINACKEAGLEDVQFDYQDEAPAGAAPEPGAPR